MLHDVILISYYIILRCIISFYVVTPGSPKTKLYPMVLRNPLHGSSQRLFFVWSWTFRVTLYYIILFVFGIYTSFGLCRSPRPLQRSSRLVLGVVQASRANTPPKTSMNTPYDGLEKVTPFTLSPTIMEVENYPSFFGRAMLVYLGKMM